MDESILRSLDTQHRMLSDIERHLDALSAMTLLQTPANV
jgi:hypothetical protein